MCISKKKKKEEEVKLIYINIYIYIWLKKCVTFTLGIIWKKNVISIIFSQQIIYGKLLLVVIGWQKNNLISKFKLEPTTTYHLCFFFRWITYDLLWKCY